MLPPAWGHVLKLKLQLSQDVAIVAPRVGACIETRQTPPSCMQREFAPRVGACIETRKPPILLLYDMKLPPAWGHVLKRGYVADHMRVVGCPPRGGMY